MRDAGALREAVRAPAWTHTRPAMPGTPDAGAADGAFLALEHVTKSFGTFRVVDDVSLEVAEGEVFALLGPSGCGKTTTLRLIAGLESPDRGRIVVGGRTLAWPGGRISVPVHERKMGMVFQSYAIWPHKTVFENVAYPLQVRRVPGGEVARRVHGVLELVGLPGLEARPATQLSGGQQQRVALARALVYEPRVLLLDEPFSNLDAKHREQMRVQLKLLLRQVGITAIFVTHDQVEALSLSDRVAVMNAGRIEQVAPPKVLYERPGTPFVRDFLGKTALLRGTLAYRATGGLLAIRLEALAGRLFYATGGPDIAEGAPVSVGMRPEDVSIEPAGGVARDGLEGTVAALLFVGEHYECRVRLESGESLLVHAPRSTELHEGERVRLSVPPEAVSVWA